MGKLKSISDLYSQLDDDFKNVLAQETSSICLLKLLTLPSSELLTQVNDILFQYFDHDEENFNFGGNRLGITLEDVLCLTGLPITGKELICTNTRDTTAFCRVFDLAKNKRYTLHTIKCIAIDPNRGREQRIKAVLLSLIHCFIVPTNNGYVETTYVQFIEDFGKINDYAWGAALLAYLVQGLKKWNTEKSAIDGNMWVFLSFFLVRIPKLRKAIGIKWRQQDYDLPLLRHIVPTIFINHSPGYLEAVEHVLSNLSDVEIIWTPYVGYVSSPYIRRHVQFGTLLVPIFCNDHYELHRRTLLQNNLRNLRIDVRRTSSGNVQISKARARLATSCHLDNSSTPTAMDYESVLIDSTEYRKGLEDTNDIRRHRKEYLAKRRIREYSCISILDLEFDTLPFQFQGMHTPTIEHVDDPVQTSVRVTPEVGNATHVDDFAEVHVAPEAGDATHVDDDTYVHVDDFAEVRVTPEAGDATHVCTEPHVDVAVDEDMQNLVDGCVVVLYFSMCIIFS
ncbi:hypothetical protein ACS0TY_012032 [Phlomoides rotata]